MTFDRPICSSFLDFVCSVRIFGTFFKDQMLANCSAECPPECSFIEFSVMQTFSAFPPASYLYYLLGQSEMLASSYFNLSAQTFQDAMVLVRPDLVPSKDVLQSTLSGKLVSLNIFYDDLVYTKIAESEKMSIIDLTAGMGGTLVT